MSHYDGPIYLTIYVFGKYLVLFLLHIQIGLRTYFQYQMTNRLDNFGIYFLKFCWSYIHSSDYQNPSGLELDWTGSCPPWTDFCPPWTGSCPPWTGTWPPWKFYFQDTKFLLFPKILIYDAKKDCERFFEKLSFSHVIRLEFLLKSIQNLVYIFLKLGLNHSVPAKVL